MTETATGQQAAQSSNGAAPAPAAPEPDTGEKWLGIFLLVAAGVIGFMAIDRLTGGRLTAGFYGADDASG